MSTIYIQYNHNKYNYPATFSLGSTIIARTIVLLF